MSDALSAVQAAYAAIGSGNLPALLELMTDDVRWKFVGDRASPYTAEVRGRSQVGEWFGSVYQVDDIQAFEPRQFLVGPDHVSVIGWERTASKPSGKVWEAEWVHVWTCRDGKVAGFYGIVDTEASAAAR